MAKSNMYQGAMKLAQPVADRNRSTLDAWTADGRIASLTPDGDCVLVKFSGGSESTLRAQGEAFILALR